MQFYRSFSIVGTLLCIVPLIVIGCTPCKDGYKQTTLDNSIARFSFEYPCDWEYRVLKFPLSSYAHFGVEAPRLKRDKSHIVSTYWYLDFSRAFPASPILGNAKVALDNELSRWEDEPDFKVLERTEVNISGVPAEKVVFTFKYHPTYIGTGYHAEESEYRIMREIFFDYNGFIWQIVADSNIDVAEAHKVHFEHLLYRKPGRSARPDRP